MIDARLASNAIHFALKNDWKEAIKLNLEILKQDKENVDALNRLAFAYFKTDDTLHAKKIFAKVLSLDPYNPIATKNIKKLSAPSGTDGTNRRTASAPLSPLMFLEEPGVTRVAPCVNIAPEKILITLSCGQEVYLKAKKYCVEIRDSKDQYLAALPDDLSHKLIDFLDGGNTYAVVIRSIGKNALSVFIRETSRGKKFRHDPSFVGTSGYVGFSSKSEYVPGEGPDVSTTGEESDEELAEEEDASSHM
jgi:tetratricopeptide (TPR) repeat protein